MNTDGHGLLGEEQTRELLGCAMEVMNVLGHGFLEKVYENALCVEMRLRGIPFQQQPRYEVMFKSEPVGEYVPDLVVAGAVVVDAKTIDAITDHEIGQVLNYLKITGLRVALILNFKHSKLQWKRVVR